jgi:hypothetical protein
VNDPTGDGIDEPFVVNLPPQPYPGLRPFERHEWPIFFGRERMADSVVADIVDKHMLVVHGDSGCGKSSLVRAAVLPRLEQENARGGIRWRTCSTTPGDAPLWNLARDIASLTGHDNDETAIEVRRIMNFGREAPAELAELLHVNGSDHACILIDQFEELFTYSDQHGPEEATLITAFCTALHRNPPAGLHVILTMRSEFLGACARFDDFALTVNATQYLLPRMQHDDLLRAIREPATLYGGEVTRSLAERLIADARGEQDQLPLIQHALMLLHRGIDRRQPWSIGLEHYNGTRGLKGLLSDHADAVMAAAEPAHSSTDAPRLVEDIFRALTDVNAEGRAIRRPRTLAQLVATSGADERAVRKVVDAFRVEGVSFLRPYGKEPIDDQERIDVSHEALIRCWGKIAEQKDGWLIREFRNGLVWRSLLVQADSFEHDPKSVLSSATTDERQVWLRRRTKDWAERYGGGWDRVQTLMAASKAARWWRRVLLGSLVVAVVLLSSTTAVIQFWGAREQRAAAQSIQAASAEYSAEVASLVADAAPGPLSQPTKERIEAVTQKFTTASGLGPRVYIQITDNKYLAAAREFELALEATSFNGVKVVVPGIEVVAPTSGRSSLRCFRQSECDGEAGRMLETANSLLRTPQLELQNLSARYQDSKDIRPRHYEIWFTGEVTLRNPGKH